MVLHVFISGTERLRADISPGSVERCLDHLEATIGRLSEMGRVAVALDSAKHRNVTYLLNRRRDPCLPT